MASKEDQREQATQLLSAHLLETGLAQTSLRQLATVAGISDRMLLYYFDDKTDVLSAALGRIATDLTDMLENAVPAGRKLPSVELIRQTTQLTRDPATKLFFRLWIEAVAAAARDEPPFRMITSAIAQGFLAWIDSRLAIDDAKIREATAAMILAMVDGLALLEICSDSDTAARAAGQMGRLLHPDD
jgi:AcrR family transcriptional regulator